jgi:hypothetical protein
MRRCLLLVCAVSSFAFAATARADTLLVDWSSLLPSIGDQYDPNSSNICTAGHIQCVNTVFNEMDRRFEPLASSCDHNALFALLYLRVTQTYYNQVSANPNFFTDTDFVNHEDPTFARRYFDAYDAYQAGNLSQVPMAWQIAFNAARNRTVSGTGDLLLGVNAHVQRDLPFVLAAIGLTFPDGTSRKPDHDKVNQILYDAYGPALSEAAQRFDPTVDTSVPFQPALGTAVGNQTLFNTVEAWREIAWRNAQRLVAAQGTPAYAQVAQSIEDYATSQAQLIAAATQNAPGRGSAARDAYCAANNGATR